jgi:hypothetical protein
MVAPTEEEWRVIQMPSEEMTEQDREIFRAYLKRRKKAEGFLKRYMLHPEEEEKNETKKKKD